MREVGMDNPAETLQGYLDWLGDERFLLAVGSGEVVYFSPGRAYQILAMSPDGATRWALRAAGPPLTIPDAGRQPLIDAFLRNGPWAEVAADTSGVDMSVVPGDLEWPRIPAIYYLFVDGAGRLYVFPPPEGAGIVPSETFDVHVYSPDGDYLASGTVPELWDYAQGDYAYVIRTAADDDPAVVRYRLTLNGQ
jgi:hypothetical protein